MATLPSDSRQPPDGHEFPDFIEDYPKQTKDELREEYSKSNLILCQSVSTSNTDLRPKMYESTEYLKYNDFVDEPASLHTRSQSLIDVSALAKQKNTKWNQMFEQRRKGLSKLKGLVIPEAAESDCSSNINIPEIKSQTPPLYLPVPKLVHNFSSAEIIPTSETDILRPSVTISSWSSNTTSSLPKYSPAFKRKSLQVYPTSISKNESDYVTNVDFPKYCDKVSPKGNKINDDDLNPPKSLESISSPTRSDCSFDYVSSTKKYSRSDTLQKLNSRTEDESDNDSAVSSSQSSYNSRYSPPPSPTRPCEINDYSKKLEDDDKSAQNRLLKPSSVEAINRKNILASAKCRSGKDIKIGSPVIRRKQEGQQQQRQENVIEISQNEEDEHIVIPEPIVAVQPTKVTTTLDRSNRIADTKPKESVQTSEIKTTKEVIQPPREPLEIRNNESSTKRVTKNIFLTLNSSTLNPVPKKLPEETKDVKPRELFSSNSKSRKPTPINVKALKKSFESLNSSPPTPQIVPVFKPALPRRNSKLEDAIIEKKVTPLISNGISKNHVEKVEIQTPKAEKRKSLENNTKTIVLKTDSNRTSLGITLSGGIDENKKITVHRIRYSSIAYHDGRLKKGDNIIAVNGKPTSGLTHIEAVELLKEPVTEFSIVTEEGQDIVPSPVSSNNNTLQRRSTSMSSVLSGNKSPSLEVLEDKKANNIISIMKDGAGLGFSIEGGKDSPQGDVPLLVKKIFTGGAADKSGNLKVGDEIIQINDIKFAALTRIEAWNAMKKIPDGKVEIHIYR